MYAYSKRHVAETVDGRASLALEISQELCMRRPVQMWQFVTCHDDLAGKMTSPRNCNWPTSMTDGNRSPINRLVARITEIPPLSVASGVHAEASLEL